MLLTNIMYSKSKYENIIENSMKSLTDTMGMEEILKILAWGSDILKE